MTQAVVINAVKVDCILFDLDGTLLDTAPDFAHILNSMRKEQRLPALDPQIIRDTVSGGARKMVGLAFGGQQGEPKFDKNLATFLERYHEQIINLTSHSQLFDGMDTLLHTLENKNIAWGIVTNKPERFSTPLMTQLNLKPQVLICPDHVNEAKPSPEPLLLACEKLNKKPATSIYVGDHKRDIDSAIAANMKSVVANWGYFSEENPKEAWQADCLAQTPSDILNFI